MSRGPLMITISNGLLTRKHVAAIGPAWAEFLCLIDWQTDDSGLVKGGKPIKIDEIAQRLGRSSRTVERNLVRLADYLEVRRTSYGLTIKIRKPKKWFGSDKSVASPRSATSVTSAPSRSDKSGGLDTTKVADLTDSDPTDVADTKKTNTKNILSSKKTLDGSRRISYDWFKEFWKTYPSNRGSKKAGFAQAKKVIKSADEIRVAIDILNGKSKHIREMQSAGKWVASLPHVERYFRKGLWEQPLDQEQTELALEPATYGRPVSREEIDAGNRQIAEWKGAQPNGPVEVTA